MKKKTDGALFVPEHSALFSNKIKFSNKLFWFPEVVALEMCCANNHLSKASVWSVSDHWTLEAPESFFCYCNFPKS